jgi:GxxExxY protein
LEPTYSKAIAIELEENGIRSEREKEILVSYRGRPLCTHRLDFVVDERLILEVKSVEHLTPVHRAQVHNYLGVSKIRVGLLINFNVVVLRDGIKRIIV